MSNVSASAAAAANLRSAESFGLAQEVVLSAEQAFIASALTFVAAAASGVSDNAIAKAVKEIKADAPRGIASDLYTSATSVGFHRRTGLVFALGGEIPEDVTARDIQKMIKQLPNGVTDEIVTNADDSFEAVEALKAALAKHAKAKAETPAIDDSEGSESDETAKAVKDVMHYLKSASGPLGKAMALAAENGATPEEREMMTALARQLIAALKDTKSGTVTSITAAA